MDLRCRLTRFRTLTLSSTLLLALVAACAPEAADGDDACVGSFCPLADGKADGPGQAEHRTWGKLIELVGDPAVNASVAADLERIAASQPGAALLARLEAAALAITPEAARFVLRGRDEPGGDLSMCGRTLFAGSSYDQRRARPRAFHLDAAGRVAVDEAGEAIAPERIRVIYNRACAPVYPDGSACAAPYTWLFHELIHVLHAMGGTLLDAIPDGSDPAPAGSNHEESWTVGRGPYAGEPVSENSLRRAAGFIERDTYFSLCGSRGETVTPQ